VEGIGEILLLNGLERLAGSPVLNQDGEFESKRCARSRIP
jgi:hypothetical protein